MRPAPRPRRTWSRSRSLPTVTWCGRRWRSRRTRSSRPLSRCSTATSGGLSRRTRGCAGCTRIQGCRNAEPRRSVDSMGADEQAAGVGKASAGKLAILYDGSCAMCRASLDGIRQFDNSGNMEPLDLHQEDVRTQFPELKLENLLQELHAVDDRS